MDAVDSESRTRARRSLRHASFVGLPNALVKLQATPTKCERSELPQIACQLQRTFGCRRARPQLRVFVSAETYAAQERLGILDEAECRAPAMQERRST